MDNWLINRRFLTFNCYIPLLKMSFCDLLRAEWVFILLPVVFVCPVSVFVVWDKVYSCFFFSAKRLFGFLSPIFTEHCMDWLSVLFCMRTFFVSWYNCFLGAFSSCYCSKQLQLSNEATVVLVGKDCYDSIKTAPLCPCVIVFLFIKYSLKTLIWSICANAKL